LVTLGLRSPPYRLRVRARIVSLSFVVRRHASDLISENEFANIIHHRKQTSSVVDRSRTNPNRENIPPVFGASVPPPVPFDMVGVVPYVGVAI
jgi:hypothetical protein